MSSSPAVVLQFGPFTLDLSAARLTRKGRDVALRPKAFDVLSVLVQRPGALVTKDELLDSVWGRRCVSESVVKAVVSELRLALADGPAATHWIETVPRRGYRFAAPMQASAVAAPTALAAPQQLGNVPSALLAPIGRELELAALAALLQAHRLVTIAGPSGVGKTRLALACAEAQGPLWREGVWFVELAPRAADSTDGLALCSAFAQALNLAPAAARDSAALAAALRPLQMLLVVDNAEHLLAALAPLLSSLLAQACGLRILVTSQEPLHIAGEHVFRLAPLDVPQAADDGDISMLMASSAMRLFLEHAAARQPGFSLDADQYTVVAGICRALDGLPLALELAAARVPVLGVQGIAGLLSGSGHASDERLQLLNSGRRGALARQKSLRNALQWSHALLDDAQRRVFRRLGVFRGGFTLTAAQVVCADVTLDRWGVLDAVHGLVDKSLVVSAADAEGSIRFMLLESPRIFALERLHEAAEVDTTRLRHLQAAVETWQEANAQALHTPSLLWVARHRSDIDNLRAALQWACRAGASACDAEAALNLVVHTRMLWTRAGLAAEGRAHCEAVRAQASLTVDPVLQRGFALATVILAMYGNAYPRRDAIQTAEQVAQAYLQVADPLQAYYTLYLCNQLQVWADGDTGDRSRLIAELTALEQPHWSELLTRHGRMMRAYEERLAGKFEAYLQFCREELVRMRRLGAMAESWGAAQGLMLAESDAGNQGAALEVGRLALSEIRRTRQMSQHATLAAIWTTLLAASGDAAGTRLSLYELLPALHSLGTPWMVQVALAWLPASEGRWQDAGHLLGWCQATQNAQPGVRRGRTIQQAQQALHDHLTQRSDNAELAGWIAAGALLDQSKAEQLALALAA